MLNKELLMTETTRKDLPINLYVDDFYDQAASGDGCGYNEYEGAGMVSRIPCWGRFDTTLNYTALSSLATVGGSKPQTIVSWRNPVSFNRFVVTRLDTGESIEFVNTNPSTSSLHTDVSFFTRADQYTEVPLIFDPPPTIIWIHLRATRSRNRVLCRRRSLGGARC